MGRRAAAGAYVLYSLHAGAVLCAAMRRRSPAVERITLAPAAGVVLSLSGAGLYVAGVRRFGSFGQISDLEAGELVTGGVYRYSRNPQIVGWGLLLSGVALGGRSAGALALVAVYFLAHRLYFPLEERSLESVFGEEYRRYRAKTPRFLGLPGGG